MCAWSNSDTAPSTSGVNGNGDAVGTGIELDGLGRGAGEWLCDELSDVAPNTRGKRGVTTGAWLGGLFAMSALEGGRC